MTMKKLLILFALSLSSLYAQEQITDYKSIYFEWDKPPVEEIDYVDKYRLWYKAAGTEAYADFVEVTAPATQARVLNLKPNTEYSAVVTAINVFEDQELESDPSNEVVFHTSEYYEKPPTPQNLTISISINIEL